MAWQDYVVDDAIAPDGSGQCNTCIAGSASDAAARSFVVALLDNYSSWSIFEMQPDSTFEKIGQSLSNPAEDWVQRTPSTPPSARANAAMCTTYDGTTIMFGGVQGGVELDETWQYDQTTGEWTQLFPALSPPPRQGAAIQAYYSGGPNAIMFGGVASGVALDDTWFWNGTTWAPLSPSTTPPARYNASMFATIYYTFTFVPCNLMFGGNDGVGGVLDDTWTWAGFDWVLQTPAASPPGRDSAASNFGGFFFGGRDAGGAALDDGWSWYSTSGPINTWLQDTTTPHPSARYGATISYDMMFGGYDASDNVLDETWELSSSWINRSVGEPEGFANAPPARAYATGGLRFTRAIYGGDDGSGGELDDTWEVEGGNGSPTSGMLSRVGDELWFAWGMVDFGGAVDAPFVYKWNPGTSLWVPVGDGGGPGSQFAVAAGTDESGGPSQNDGYLAYSTSDNRVLVFQWQDPDWVLLSDGTTESWWSNPNETYVIADPSDGQPLLTAEDYSGDVLDVLKWDGAAWNQVGGASGIVDNEGPGGIDSVGHTYWILPNPDNSGDFAVVSTSQNDINGNGPAVAFWTGSWSTQVEGGATDTALWGDDVETDEPYGGSAWATPDAVVACVKYLTDDANLRVVSIPWGGASWTGYPGNPDSNIVMPNDDPYRPEYDYSGGVIAITDGGRIGVVSGADGGSFDVYRFWIAPSVGPAVNASFSL